MNYDFHRLYKLFKEQHVMKEDEIVSILKTLGNVETSLYIVEMK